MLRPAPPVSPIDGVVPRDLDDGQYQDLNANGQVEFPDVNVLFQHRGSAAVENHAEAYDFTGDGAINLQDVIALFRQV